MTIHPGGQNICGVSIGVLALESYFPKQAPSNEAALIINQPIAINILVVVDIVEHIIGYQSRH